MNFRHRQPDTKLLSFLVLQLINTYIGKKKKTYIFNIPLLIIAQIFLSIFQPENVIFHRKPEICHGGISTQDSIILCDLFLELPVATHRETSYMSLIPNRIMNWTEHLIYFRNQNSDFSRLIINISIDILICLQHWVIHIIFFRHYNIHFIASSFDL